MFRNSATAIVNESSFKRTTTKRRGGKTGIEQRMFVDHVKLLKNPQNCCSKKMI